MLPISELTPSVSDARAAVRGLLERTRVTEVMITPVRCAKATMTRAEVARVMTDVGISAMPIVDDEGVVTGIVTKTDVVRQDHGEGRRTEGQAEDPLRVEEFMTPYVLRLRPADTLQHAVQLMASAQLPQLVVIDEAGRAMGLLSSLSLLQWLAGVSQAALLDEEVGMAQNPTPLP